jgi:hypothetical protein
VLLLLLLLCRAAGRVTAPVSLTLNHSNSFDFLTGQIVGASCVDENDCSDSLVCVNGKCAP